MFDDIGAYLKRNNHWVGAWGIVIGIAIALLTVYWTKQSAELSLRFKTVRVAQASVPSVRILDESGQIITTDVYGLELIVWNSGDFSLGTVSDRVRQPLTISFASEANILGVNIQDSKNISSEHIKFRVTPDKKVVEINWIQFDPGDAFKLIIVYGAKTQASVNYSGRIVGGQITNLSEYRDTNPNASLFAIFFEGFFHDLQNRPKLLGTALILVIVQFGIIAVVFKRGKPSLVLTVALIVVSLAGLFIALVPRWWSGAPL